MAEAPRAFLFLGQMATVLDHVGNYAAIALRRGPYSYPGTVRAERISENDIIGIDHT